MTITLIGSEKGGVGKSMIATNLAAAYALAGANILLVDADRQGSAMNWAARREKNGVTPPVPYTQVSGNDFGDHLLKFSGQFEHLIIDAAGHDSPEFRTALLLADLLISPLQPAQFDVDTLHNLNTTIEGAQTIRETNGTPPLAVGMIINRAPTHHANTEVEEAQAALAGFPALNFTGVVIHDRISYRRAAIEGLSVLEQSPLDQKSVDETNFLFQQVQHEQAQNSSARRAS